MTKEVLATPLPPDARQRLSELAFEAADMSVALGQLLNGNPRECQTAVQELLRGLDNRIANCINVLHDNEESS